MSYPTPEGTQPLEHLGAGSVFDVALVREAGRVLICKRLSSRALREPAGRAAMVREAKALAMARHPALPVLVRVGADGHGPFVLETRREGTSLRDVLAGWQARGRLPPRSLVAHIVRAAFETLAELQELQAPDGGPLGLVHGDLAPDHVLMGPIGDIGLVDLGAARYRGLDPGLETGDRGTLPFVAPEVARGESTPTPCADVYALAATLAFFATGRPLTRAREEAAMLAEIGQDGLRPDALDMEGTLSPAERAALTCALARDPNLRPESARGVLEILDRSSWTVPLPFP
jgi:serine/threonine-protein kinase